MNKTIRLESILILIAGLAATACGSSTSIQSGKAFSQSSLQAASVQQGSQMKLLSAGQGPRSVLEKESEIPLFDCMDKVNALVEGIPLIAPVVSGIGAFGSQITQMRTYRLNKNAKPSYAAFTKDRFYANSSTSASGGTPILILSGNDDLFEYDFPKAGTVEGAGSNFGKSGEYKFSKSFSSEDESDAGIFKVTVALGSSGGTAFQREGTFLYPNWSSNAPFKRKLRPVSQAGSVKGDAQIMRVLRAEINQTRSTAGAIIQVIESSANQLSNQGDSGLMKKYYLKVADKIRSNLEASNASCDLI